MTQIYRQRCEYDEDVWHGCYVDGWQKEIVPEAFSHPAKFSRALIRRIYQHAFAEGWLHVGDTVVDPFGGVGLGALDAMWNGLNYVGVELEPKFVALGEQNIALWQRKYGSKANFGSARILQGDSRKLSGVIASADFVCSSPPYTGQTLHCGGIDPKKFAEPWRAGGNNQATVMKNYGRSPGQLGSMPEGRFDAVVSSPPFGGCLESVDQKFQAVARPGRTIQCAEYGASDGQIGNQSGDTFWQAAREIVAQCYAVLRSGGMAIWVVKDFVRNGKRVPFSDQWQTLCESQGFQIICRHRAMLVAHHGEQDDMLGETKQLTTARKSFFRRLAESKGSPAIDWEDVICIEKPA